MNYPDAYVVLETSVRLDVREADIVIVHHDAPGEPRKVFILRELPADFPIAEAEKDGTVHLIDPGPIEAWVRVRP